MSGKNRFLPAETQPWKHNFVPSRIFNVDETGVPTVPTKILKMPSAKGVKRVAKVVSAEHGKTITLVCSMNAIGNFIPPAFIFHGCVCVGTSWTMLH